MMKKYLQWICSLVIFIKLIIWNHEVLKKIFKNYLLLKPIAIQGKTLHFVQKYTYLEEYKDFLFFTFNKFKNCNQKYLYLYLLFLVSLIFFYSL